MNTTSKPILKLGFTDYFSPIDEFFTDVLSKTYEIVRDDWNPNYLMFCDDNFGTNNKTFNNRNVLKILFTGENRRPQEFDCHYAFSFNHDDTDRLYRLPLYVVDNWVYTKKMGWPDISYIDYDYKEKTGFCSFVVRNGGCKQRNDIFHKLSAYKQVDSGGPLFNNVGDILSRDPSQFHLSKLDFLRARKFNICYENSSYPGYVTEKLFQALYAKTVPIYWGSPTASIDFNPNCFISRHDYETDEQMIDTIIGLDKNQEWYDGMLDLSPVHTTKFFSMERLNNWFHQNVYKGVW